jgi:hypothetical protein
VRESVEIEEDAVGLMKVDDVDGRNRVKWHGVEWRASLI